jgi:arsenic resistance protein ArsH
MMPDLPNIDPAHLHPVDPAIYAAADDPGHPPRILILHGLVRARSYSRGVGDEAERLLRWFGAEVRRFDPSGLPLLDDADAAHSKVQELRDLAMKAQIDWIPLSTGGVRPTQGKTLALTQVSGGSQSFNAVNQMRILGRWMRMVTIPNQSSAPRAWDEFDQDLRMRPSPLYVRLVDVCEELMKFTWMRRPPGIATVCA